MPADPFLRRTTFKTSRLIEFCSEKELIAQTGHRVADWPLVILKELVNNAIDSAEEHETAPAVIEVEVSTERNEIIIDGRTVKGDLNPKSVRKAIATIREHGAEAVAVVLQGNLAPGDVLDQAGISAQLKGPRPQ